ncbi:MAG: hypothetical protein ABIT08_05030 [Bacteroidia bacterium]
MKKKKTTQSKKGGASDPAKKKQVHLMHPELGNIWVSTDKILIAVSGGHKIKVLVLISKSYDWCERSCSLNDFLNLLDNKNFERINKFYVINWALAMGHDHKEKRITFITGFSLILDHKINPSVFKKRYL